MSNSSTPLDPVAIAAGSGLKPTLSRINGQSQAEPSQLKLGPKPITEKLKEQVSKTLQDEEAAAANGDRPPGEEEEPNGHDANGDVDMGSPKDRSSRAPTRERSPTVHEVKLEIDVDKDPDLVSPTEGETLPPVPGIFRIADLKREVEAVRDRRKMIKLGTSEELKSSPVLPSVLATTLFDGGEKYVENWIYWKQLIWQDLVNRVLARLVAASRRVCRKLNSIVESEGGEAQG